MCANRQAIYAKSAFCKGILIFFYILPFMQGDFTHFAEAPQQIVIDEEGKYYMLGTARWGRFLGIVVVCVILLVLFLLPVFLQLVLEKKWMAPVPTIFITIYVTVMIGLYFYPLYCQLRFSQLSIKGIKRNDQAMFVRALKFQKKMYKYIGVLTIIVLIIYGIFAFFLIATVNSFS